MTTTTTTRSPTYAAGAQRRVAWANGVVYAPLASAYRAP